MRSGLGRYLCLMKILASRSRLWIALFLVTTAGALVFALSPVEGRGANIALALGATLFLLEVGLAIADDRRLARLRKTD